MVATVEAREAAWTSGGNTFSTGTVALVDDDSTTLFHYNIDRDAFAGLVVPKGFWARVTDPRNFQRWMHVLATDPILPTMARLTISLAMKDFANDTTTHQGRLEFPGGITAGGIRDDFDSRDFDGDDDTIPWNEPSWTQLVETDGALSGHVRVESPSWTNCIGATYSFSASMSPANELLDLMPYASAQTRLRIVGVDLEGGYVSFCWISINIRLNETAPTNSGTVGSPLVIGHRPRSTTPTVKPHRFRWSGLVIGVEVSHPSQPRGYESTAPTSLSFESMSGAHRHA